MHILQTINKMPSDCLVTLQRIHRKLVMAFAPGMGDQGVRSLGGRQTLGHLILFLLCAIISYINYHRNAGLKIFQSAFSNYGRWFKMWKDILNVVGVWPSLEGALNLLLNFIDFQLIIFTTLKCFLSRIELIKPIELKVGLWWGQATFPKRGVWTRVPQSTATKMTRSYWQKITL